MNSVVVFGVLLLVVVATSAETLDCPPETLEAASELHNACWEKYGKEQDTDIHHEEHMSTTAASIRIRRQDNDANDEQMVKCVLETALSNPKFERYTSGCPEQENGTVEDRVTCIVEKLLEECPPLLSKETHDDTSEEQEK